MDSMPTYLPDTAGLYIHIPFCRKACHYCDFHFSTQLSYQQDMVDAIATELTIRSKELVGKSIKTIYLGGGTPSVLTQDQLHLVLRTIKTHYGVTENVEITFEANPDDLTSSYINMLIAEGVNRLSIGLQSFDESELKWMNRSHTVDQSLSALKMLEEIHELDYSIDLIFGSPYCTEDLWKHNLDIISTYRSPHISCYNLTVEPNTKLDYMVKQGSVTPLPDEKHTNLYHLTHDRLTALGYDHYEISNYAQEGKYSRHNTGYWFGNAYMGVGPGAHSYDGINRSWNVANNATYIKGFKNGTLPSEREQLSPTDKYNESIMVGLRTMWGITIESMQLTKGQNFYLQSLIDDKLATISESRLILTEAGRLMSDTISAQLFAE